MKICLLTPGQPSSNPRLVKEADALTGIGYEVHVICSHWVPWADEADQDLLHQRSWTCTYVGGHPDRQPLQYLWTRIRYRFSRHIIAAERGGTRIQRWALSRAQPELESAAKAMPADLYIAHYPAALPAAVAAAEKHSARIGYDAEDFYAGTYPLGTPPSALDDVITLTERHFLPRSDYVTAASPGIADAYVQTYNIPRPTPVLNVFPLSQRPRTFRLLSEDKPLTMYWFSQTIGAKRGLEDVVKAMGMLQRDDIQLHLRGIWQPAYRDHLINLAQSVGLSPDRIISHDPAPPDEMVRLAARYDVGLALEQGMSLNRDICLTNKIFTYLLAGNAIVATATEGQRAIMNVIGGAGFSYEPGCVDTLAHHLREWCKCRESLEMARRKAWEWGARRYNWDFEKEKFLQVIENILLKHDTAEASNPSTISLR